MNYDKPALAVAALASGTVIDHIPNQALFEVARILDLEHVPEGHPVTIGYNLSSATHGVKGIIKVGGIEYDDATINRIALVAPTAVINVIRDYHVASKRPVHLDDTLRGIVRCPNPKCITNNEPMDTIFHVEGTALRCHYCNHKVQRGCATLH